ncbi:glycosyltransferase family 2 protein [Muribaculum intestinale]|uniref:glycosyltransferase family 2 protein n=2 Tax=Muribaculum intestinale TaxID=1796646 RepID=UPI00248D2DD9|nr:glycosyltransferase [Muribaculum intestinale]
MTNIIQPKVSIVIPVYNVERYIDRCIQSVLNQTLQNFEIILVDDGSPDNCPEICDKYANSDSRIKVVHKANAGLGMACNSGIENATGEYIAFLDSDDWIDPEMYLTMCSIADSQNADIVFTGLRRINEKGESYIMSQSNQKKIHQNSSEIQSLALDMIASKPDIKIERRIAMSAKVVLYRTDLIQKYNIRFVSERQFMSEDLIFNLDYLRHSSLAIELPMTFYNYFVNESSLTNNIRKDRFDKYIILREELINRYFPAELLWRERINRFFIGYVRQAIGAIFKSNKLTEFEKYHWVKDICHNPIWKQLRKEYPVTKMPIAHRVIFSLICREYILLLRMIFSLTRN